MPNLTARDVRERVAELLPNVTDEHELHDACLWFAARLNWEVDYGGSADTSVFGTETSAPAWSLSGYYDSPLAHRSRRTELTPEEIAHRAAFLAPERNRGDGTPEVTPAPDDYTGVRATIVKRRSAKGNDSSIVVNHGTPAVSGELRTTVRPYCVPIGPPCHRRASRTVVPFHHATGDSASVSGELLARTIESDARPLTNGRYSGIDIARITSRAYRHLGVPELLGTESEAFAEITPELYDMIPNGIAVHRSDMSGQTGVLSLTQRIAEVNTAKRPARERIARPKRYRNTDKRITTTVIHIGASDTPAWSGPMTRTELPAPTETTRPLPFIVASDGTTERAEAWLFRGLRTVARPPLDKQRAKRKLPVGEGVRAKRTALKVTRTPETPEAWAMIAEALNRGERATGTTDEETRWTISRSDKRGTYSGSCDGVKWSGRRTPEAVGRLMAKRLNAR